MATIESSIMLMDGMSRPLNNIIGAIETTINALNSVNNTNVNIDTSRLSSASQMIASAGADLLAYQERIQAQINRNTSAQQRFNETVNDVSNLRLNKTNIDVFDTTGITRYTQEVNSLRDLLAQMDGLTVSPNLRLDVENQDRLNALNARIEQIKQVVENFSNLQVDVGTMAGNNRLERTRALIYEIVREQGLLNGVLNNMDVTGISQGYQRLNAILDRTQISIRDNIASQERFNNALRLGNAGQVGPQIFSWDNSSNMQVFTSQGTQRYRQELNDLNSMLNRINGININPTFRINSGATSDIENINQRIEALKENMKALSTNNLGLSTEQSNARLERMRAQLSTILQVQNNLNGAMGRMDIADINAQYQRLNDILGNTEADIRDNTAAQDEFNRSILQGSRHSDGLLSKIGRIALAYAGFQTLRSGINLSDTLTQNVARLNLMNDGNQTTDELQAMIYQAARNSRGDALANIESISKMGLMAGDAFSSNTELIGFMELINKQFKISGTSAEGISAAMLQLTQAMGAGALRGEELNSILEQAPLILKNIANYLKVPVGQIKDLASQGKITSEVVKKAMFNAADTINQQFNSIPLTFADITTSMRNEAVKKFQNISSQFSSALNSERFRGFTNSLVNSIGVVLDIASRGMIVLTALGATIYDNWAVISPVIKSVAGIMSVYAGAVAISTIANGTMAVAQLASAVAMTIYNVATGKAIALTHQQTLAQWGLNSAILANPIVLIVSGVVAALYLGVAAFNKFAGTSVSATGIIVGAFYVVGAVIHNVVGAVYNATLQLGSSIYNYMAGIVEFIGNIFTHPITAISNLFLNFTNFIIDQLKVIGRITDTILGTNVSNTLGEIQNSLNNFVLDKVGENSFKVERKDFSKMMVDYKDPWQAAQNGYNFISDFNLKDEGKEVTEKLLGDIAKNTEVSANNSDLTAEEIKYMRDLAEMEVINRFTTAEIKVEVGGITNQVNNSMDVESIYSNISDKLRETVAVVAEGVYD